MSIKDILKHIPADLMLPSTTAAEPTRIKFALRIEILGVNEGDWYKASLPLTATSDKGKAPLIENEIKGHPAQEVFSLICADIDFLVQIREKKPSAAVYRDFRPIGQDRGLFTHVRQEVQLQKAAQSLDILASQQKLQSQQVALSQVYDNKLTKIQDRQDALSHELMEFRVQAQENYNHLTSQLSELVDYINRGRDDKKGKSGSSRGPQPPPDDRGRPGSGDGGSRTGGGSRSEPARKRGGGGAHRREWRYWIGGN
ncbi:hypothetical protein F511_26914 [Dorcoceras hygrometricum]|uniref:Uncharacterized protein n=1 Tax=Dorcoceras hygrometricum TaxID=472368 RepID=A0A2Z7D5U7_9LAMI|nr:hypothetical protein F511_26914 [Dorcoceras hygrometricum]